MGGVREISAVSATHAWAVNSNSLLRTQDGGGTWSTIGDGGTDVHFFTSANGWLLTSNDAMTSTDGGETWTARLQVPGGLRTMSFISMTTGWVASLDGQLFRTTDTGANWTALDLPSAEPMSLKFVDAQTGWLSIHHGPQQGGTVYRTTNGGATWTDVMTVDAPDTLNRLEAFGSARAWILVGDDFLQQTVLRTTNGGTTWTPHSGDTLFDAGRIRFINATEGWIGGAELHHTTDGGATWTLMETPPFGDEIYFTVMDIVFINSEIGWISGLKGQFVNGVDGFIMKTTTGGE